MLKSLSLLILLASPLASAHGKAPAKVLMKSISYDPKILEIEEGDAVIWENVSLTDHSATGADFDTGLIDPKAVSKPTVFAKAGTYRYHCSLHGRTMSGTIVVKSRRN